MRVEFELNKSFWEIEDAREDLDSLYDYMALSNSSTKEDLRGLDVAIEVLGKVSKAIRRNDGL